jgi:Uma2 family endonuclease
MTLAAKHTQPSNGLQTYRNYTNAPTCNWPADLGEAYSRPRGPYTIEDTWKLLEEEPLELYNGWLVWQEMTDPEERRITGTIQEILSLAARASGFGQAYPDQLECLMQDGNTFKPDVCVISTDLFEDAVQPVVPDKDHKVLKASPELVVELRSPSNRRRQEREKRRIYFENGAQVIWDVDPRKRKIWVYEATNQSKATEYSQEDEITCSQLFPGWQRKVADFFNLNLSAEQIVGPLAHQWRTDAELETLRGVILRQARRRFGAENLPPALADNLTRYTLLELNDLADNLALSPGLQDWLQTFPPE